MSRAFPSPWLIAAFVVAICSQTCAQLETRATFRLAHEPGWVAAGDFNRDGKSDLAVLGVQPGPGQISILLGKGDGTFQAPTDYAVGESPNSIAISDFNRDGKLDLVVTNRLGDSISIVMGNGDGTFQPAMNVVTPAEPTFVGVGDFNGDRIPDLVVSDRANPCPCLSVFLGNGDGTFPPAIVTVLPGPANTVGLGDWNGDGRLDLVTVGQAGGKPSAAAVLLGNGDGTFRRGASYALDPEPESVAVADFNRDGKLDLAVAQADGRGVAVLLGNGDGTFQSRVIYQTASSASVNVADMNRDGISDLVVGGAAFPNLGGSVTVFTGNGDGTFQTGKAYPAGGSFAAVVDFNGDDLPDVASPDGLSFVSILLNTGAVSFAPTTALTFGSQFVGTASAPRSVTQHRCYHIVYLIDHREGTFSVEQQYELRGNCGPNASCAISVIFQPVAKGAMGGIISVFDSASSKPQVVALSAATVVTLTPPQLNFGPQKVGTTSPPQTATLENHGDTVLNITEIVILTDYQQTNNCGNQVAPGGSCTIRVKFAPTRTGALNFNVQVIDDGGASPQKLEVTGTGT